MKNAGDSSSDIINELSKSNDRTMDAIRRIRESLSPRDRALFDGLLAGEKQTQMAEKFKCTQPAISNRVNILRRNLRWLLED